MTGSDSEKAIQTMRMTGEIVAAYVSHNHVAPADVPSLIASVHSSLGLLASGSTVAADEVSTEKPSAAQIRKSVQADGIISFIDGRTYKTLKRHLTAHGLDPDRYRERYGLPVDYPMVSANYSEKRSSLAKTLGLGRPAGAGSEKSAAAAAPQRKRKRA